MAFVVCEEGLRLFADPYFARVVFGATRELTAAGMQLVLLTVPSTKDYQASAVHYLSSGHVDGALSLAAKAHWEGEIHARAAVIAGRISGKLVVEEKVEIGASAVLHADIVARSIAVAKGAVIDGDVTVTSGQPVVQFEERRGTR